MGPWAQALACQRHGGGIEVLAEQLLAAFGQCRTEFTVGTGRFEHSLIVLARQTGQ
ncbi:hypothetical protein D3C78_1756650 [compost metagenome]